MHDTSVIALSESLHIGYYSIGKIMGVHEAYQEL